MGLLRMERNENSSKKVDQNRIASLSLVVLCTRPTREHYKAALIATRVTLLLQYFPLGLVTRKEKRNY